MPWPSLVPPTAGTVITVAWESAMVNDPLLWLRLMTGNADPPANDYVVVSQGTGSTAWGKVTANVLGPGAAVGNIGYQPANRAGDTMTGALVVSYADAGQPSNGTLFLGQTGGAAYISKQGTDIVVAGGRFVVSNQSFLNGAVQINGTLQVNSGQLTVNGADIVAASGDLRATRAGGATGYVFVAGHPLGYSGARLEFDGNPVWHGGNDGLNSGLDADLIRNIPPGNGTNQIPVSNGVTCAGLWAARAESLGGRVPTATPTPDAIPLADATGKLDQWVTPASFAIPSGLGCWVRNASEIPAGFARETTLDGLMLVGDGSSYGQTFAAGTAYGNTWAHRHNGNSLAVSVTSVTVTGAATGGPSDQTGQSANINGLATAGGVSLNTTTHTHSLNGVSLAVSASGTGSGSATGNTSDATWLPPMRAVVWARKT